MAVPLGLWLLVAALVPSAAGATVLCSTPSGTIKLRDTCRHLERALDLRSLDLHPFDVAPVPVPVGKPCPPDAVRVADVCVDRYEESVWAFPAGDTTLIRKAQRGRATLADLQGAGATQLAPVNPTGCDAPPYPETFPPNGNWTAPVYAISVPGVRPSACITWFQAEQACALVGKHLLTNQQWQRAASGTPDPPMDDGTTTCVITNGPQPTGSRSACRSTWGVYDMIGNVYEWVAEWSETASGCQGWPGADYGADATCVGGSTQNHVPAARARGGYWGLLGGPSSGIFAILEVDPPSFSTEGIGFRCGR